MDPFKDHVKSDYHLVVLDRWGRRFLDPYGGPRCLFSTTRLSGHSNILPSVHYSKSRDLFIALHPGVVAGLQGFKGLVYRGGGW